MRNWQTNFIVFALGCVGGFGAWGVMNGGVSKDPKGKLENQVSGTSRRDISMEASRKARSARGHPDQLSTRQKLLNQIFDTNPKAINGFTAQMFDHNLLVDREEGFFWGLSEGQANALSDGMKEIFLEICMEESKTYSTEQLDNGKLIVVARALNSNDVESVKDRIRTLFRRYFLPSLADCLAEKVVADQRSVFAALSGLSRIVEITPTTDETYRLSGRGSNIRVTYLDAKMSSGEGFDPSAEYPRGMKARTDEIVKDLPLIYNHFFEEKK